MKLLIAISLIAIAFAPVASASYAGAGANSYGYGNCETGTSAYNTNSAGANAGVSGVGSAYANAGTYCQAYQDFFTGQTIRYSQIGAAANACTVATGCSYNSAVWTSSSSGYCQMYVSGQGNMGCPAGNAPYVPALLP